MNTDDLRECKELLEYIITYSPDDTAPDKAFDIAEIAALTAQHRYDDLAPVFALLDSYDELAQQVKKLETVIAAQTFLNDTEELEQVIADHEKRITNQATDQIAYLGRFNKLEHQLAEFLVLDEDGKVCHVELVYLDHASDTHTTAIGKANPLEHTCEGCGLPEDGIKVRNVTIRQSGLRLCTDCAYPKPS